MINTSTELGLAIAYEYPQRVILKMCGTTLSNEDIAASSGLDFIDEVNADTELRIGNAISNTLSFTLLNQDGQFNTVDFSGLSIDAFLGARATTATETSLYVGGRTVALSNGSTVISGASQAPYLYNNGTPVSRNPPTFPVYALVLIDTTLTVIGANGEAMRYTLTGSRLNYLDTYTPTAVELAQYKRYARDRVAFSHETAKTPTTYKWFKINGRTVLQTDTYEFVSLGKFTADKPERQRERLIRVTASDRMRLFDKSSDGFYAALTYPATLGEIFTQLCAFVGVETETTTFINSSKSFAEAPMTIKDGTCRELLSWIAEAACSFARFNRDGKLELAWFGTTGKMFTPRQTFSLTPAEYAVKKIDKLQVSVSKNDIGVVIPEDASAAINGYQIVDNPLLYGAKDEDIRPYAQLIYARLIQFNEYTPVRLKTVGDWRIQAGDIISVKDTNDITYTFPVFYHAIHWNGKATSDFEATGSELRPPMSAHNRELIRDGARFHEFKVDIEGFESLLNNARLRFDENGLTVFNAGMRVKNGMDNSADTMFEVDTDGNIILGSRMKITPDVITINDPSVVPMPPGMEPETIEITRDAIKIAQMKFSSDWEDCSIVSPLTMHFIHQYGDEGSFFFSTQDGEGSANSQTRINVRKPATAASGKAVFWFDASKTWGDGWYTLAMSSSSRRYKEAIRYMENADALSICEKLKPATYHHKSEPTDKRDMGFIAEDVDEVEKTLVFYDKDGQPDDVDYLHVAVLCIGAIKELSAKINKLESRIKELERKEVINE